MPLKIQQDDLSGVNMTPMIDVVFLLVIFFMVGTKFPDAERNLHIDIPKVSQAAPLTAAPDPRIIYVLRNGTIRYDEQDVSLQQLIGSLRAARAEYPDVAVIIRGDGAVAYQSVIHVADACQRAGFTKLRLAGRLNHSQK